LQTLISQGAGNSGKIPSGTLRRGGTGAAITELQRLLTLSPTRCYTNGLITGYFGTLTQEAVRCVQRASGLPVTGEADPLTYGVISGGIIPDAGTAGNTPTTTNGSVTTQSPPVFTTTDGQPTAPCTTNCTGTPSQSATTPTVPLNLT